MEITKQTTKANNCPKICITDSGESYILVTDFMLGDADANKEIIQYQGKKVTKDLKNLILALEIAPTDPDDIKIMKDHIERPYSESSSWSYQGYELIFIDKEKKIYNCSIKFDENELNIIKAEKQE